MGKGESVIVQPDSRPKQHRLHRPNCHRRFTPTQVTVPRFRAQDTLLMRDKALRGLTVRKRRVVVIRRIKSSRTGNAIICPAFSSLKGAGHDSMSIWRTFRDPAKVLD